MVNHGLMIRKQNSLVLINYLPMSNFLSNDKTSILPREIVVIFNLTNFLNFFRIFCQMTKQQFFREIITSQFHEFTESHVKYDADPNPDIYPHMSNV